MNCTDSGLEKFARNFQGFIDDHGARRRREPSNSATAARKRLRSTAAMRSMRQCSAWRFDEFVDFCVAIGGDAEKIFGEAAALRGLRSLALTPKGAADFGGLIACPCRPGRASAKPVREICGGFPLERSLAVSGRWLSAFRPQDQFTGT